MKRDYLFDYKELRWIYKWNSSRKTNFFIKNSSHLEVSASSEDKVNLKEMERH